MTHDADQPGSAAIVVAGRYELLCLLGSGGAGRVHAARDLVTGAQVAVKLLEASDAASSTRAHREISALRLLRLPGVVGLLDEGRHAGQRFLVMDVVEGRPFPGVATPVDWETLAPLVLSLLEILARVHASGVVHRDLKPSNVLVDEAGRVTVLDFGISWGPALGGSVTTRGTIVGTPEYLAPEQFIGSTGDARTDLYATGVMFYEALTGRLPHTATDFAELVELRRTKTPVPVRIAAPSVPREVATVLDQLLAMDADDRPQSAGEALHLLFGERLPRGAARQLPRLGGDAPVESLVEAACAGSSIDVSGPSGSGRTRLLTDAAERLAALGRAVHWILPGSAPYASLAGVLGGLADLSGATPDEARTEIDARIEARLRAGAVIVADDAHRADAWTAAALDRCRDAGCVIRVTSAPAEPSVRLGEIAEADLRPLFAGPDRIFHLREDGARELWRRTGGLAARVVTEIAAWARAGFAHWDGPLVVVRPDALNRLRGGVPVGDELLLRPGDGTAGSPHLDEILAWVAFAWPHSTPGLLVALTGQPLWSLAPVLDALAEQGFVRRLPDGSVQPLVIPRTLHAWPPERRRAAHHALAAALPPGTPLRLRHLAAAGEPQEVADEAWLLAPELTRQGRTGDALVVIEEGLAAARRGADRDRETRMLAELTKTCLADGTPAAVDRALYEMSRASGRIGAVAHMTHLLHAARAATSGDAERALEMAAKTDPFDDVDLELWRQAQRVRASRRLTLEREAEVLDEVDAWAHAANHPRARASVAAWRALHRHKRGDYAESADLHLEAARQTDRVPARMAFQLNAGLALSQIGRLAEAQTVAESLRDLAARCRNPVYEAYAEYLGRVIAYKRAATDGPDAELVAAVETLGGLGIVAPLLLNEAAAAWRAGRLPEGRDLASRCVAAWGGVRADSWGLVARALALACGAQAEVTEVTRLSEEARRCTDADIAIQTAALLAAAVPARSPELRSIAASRAAELTGIDPDLRGAVVSVREATGIPASDRSRSDR